MSGGEKKGGGKDEAGRKERLATALRANLARRRQQKHGRAADEPGERSAAPESSESSDSHK